MTHPVLNLLRLQTVPQRIDGVIELIPIQIVQMSFKITSVPAVNVHLQIFHHLVVAAVDTIEIGKGGLHLPQMPTNPLRRVVFSIKGSEALQ